MSHVSEPISDCSVTDVGSVLKYILRSRILSLEVFISINLPSVMVLSLSMTSSEFFGISSGNGDSLITQLLYED